MPSVAYFTGKVGLVGVTSVTLQTVLLLVVATLFFDVDLPTDPERWAVFVLVFGLGVFSTVLGIAYSSLATSRSIGAVVVGPMLVLQFISSVYIAFDNVPTWLQQVASLFLVVDRAGHAVGVLPGQDGGRRDGRVVGDRQDGPRPPGLGHRGPDPVRHDVPLVQARNGVSAGRG